jgi:DNA-binding transcriptional ArsR family regulator
MPLPRPLPDAVVELLAQRLHLFAQPLRLKLIDRLERESATVQELADELDAAQQNVSQHLALMHRAGILSRQKQGTQVRYKVIDPHVRPLLDQAASSLARQHGEIARWFAPNRNEPPDGPG